jgi:hypothetical protein
MEEEERNQTPARARPAGQCALLAPASGAQCTTDVPGVLSFEPAAAFVPALVNAFAPDAGACRSALGPAATPALPLRLPSQAVSTSRRGSRSAAQTARESGRRMVGLSVNANAAISPQPRVLTVTGSSRFLAVYPSFFAKRFARATRLTARLSRGRHIDALSWRAMKKEKAVSCSIS